MHPELSQVALRQQAVFIPNEEQNHSKGEIQAFSAQFAANLSQLGLGLSEDLLHALNHSSEAFLQDLWERLREVTGVKKNWTPLVKGWDTPTGESQLDHLITLFANFFDAKGTRLPCGHLIPEGTFPLERYNGCPFCGTPFEAGEIEVMGQNKKLKVLDLWGEKELDAFFADLLASQTALDATQMDSLKLLLKSRPLPDTRIGMKETRMAVVDLLLELDKDSEAARLFDSPSDILRYLWYKHTGFLQLVEPKVIIARKSRNQRHMRKSQDRQMEGKASARQELKLKYSRKEGRRVAQWLNQLDMSPEQAAQSMHPKREIWVRFIRALRLVEYSKKSGFEHLKSILETFHSENYRVWAGELEQARLSGDAERSFKLLKQRPGAFARGLFANMLTFGKDATLDAFKEVADQVPARLLFTLAMYAGNYFDKNKMRAVKPLGGVNKTVPPHPLVTQKPEDELRALQKAVEELCVFAMEQRFARSQTQSRSIYIDPALYKMPVAIGDRSDQIQDLPVELMGTRFPIDGDKVRLFMQWGTGLPAQHLDMDLSCHIAYADRFEVCSYYNLVATGCKHSGDIRSIPDQIGTAEYIEIDLKPLAEAGARYLTFTCNAYSRGELSPNLLVGWMNSEQELHISAETGVAYDPSAVQHQVRITQGLSKGLVFGILEVEKREIVWLEMAFQGQTVQNMHIGDVQALLDKLDSKLNIGALLELKAKAQNLEILPEERKDQADESYTRKWARNAAAVTQLLID